MRRTQRCRSDGTPEPSRAVPASSEGSGGPCRRFVIAAIRMVTVLVAGALLPMGAPGQASALGSVSGEGGNAGEVLREARAVWVVRTALRTPQSAQEAISFALDINANMLLVQVNGRSEAYYASEVLPRATDVLTGFDPLRFLVREGRQAGLEIHAWVNVFVAAGFGVRPSSPKHPLNRHPEWVTVDKSGRSIGDYNLQETKGDPAAVFFEPGLPSVRDFVAEYVAEIVENYDVDGIHLDYIRYPSPDFGFNPENRRRFEALTGYDPLRVERSPSDFVRDNGKDSYAEFRSLWDRYREDQVTSMVRRLHEEISSRKPWVRLSAAVMADLRDAVGSKFQNWPSWLQAGIVDFVVPMSYSLNTGLVERQVKRALELAGPTGRKVLAGLGAYLFLAPQVSPQGAADTEASDRMRGILDQIAIVRSAGAQGISLFSFNSMAGSSEVRRLLRAEAFQYPAAVPDMAWKPSRSVGN